MNLAASNELGALIWADVLPHTLLRTRIVSSRFLRFNSDKRLVLRVQLAPSGYFDVFAQGPARGCLARAGTDEDRNAVNPPYEEIAGPDPALWDGLAAATGAASFVIFKKMTKGSFLNEVVTMRPGVEVVWASRMLEPQQQSSNWCIPTCMSILSPILNGHTQTPEQFAEIWGQQKGQPLLPTQVAAFENTCKSEKMVRRMTNDIADWQWFKQLQTATLIAWNMSDHAIVCSGVTEHGTSVLYGENRKGYHEINPATNSDHWVAIPDEGLQVGMAFSAPAA